jgi:hypothetical protein
VEDVDEVDEGSEWWGCVKDSRRSACEARWRCMYVAEESRD